MHSGIIRKNSGKIRKSWSNHNSTSSSLTGIPFVFVLRNTSDRHSRSSSLLVMLSIFWMVCTYQSSVSVCQPGNCHFLSTQEKGSFQLVLTMMENLIKYRSQRRTNFIYLVWSPYFYQILANFPLMQLYNWNMLFRKSCALAKS